MWAVPAEIQTMAHALSGRRFHDEFLEWFLPEYTRGQGTKHMAGLIFTAAEFLIELFCEVWATQGQTNKIPKGRRKFQVSPVQVTMPAPRQGLVGLHRLPLKYT